jgi:hypothetical protein
MLVPGENPDAFAAIRRGIHVLAEWVILPSLLLALVSGLLSIAVHRPFMNLGWPWLKALLGLAMFEGTLLAVQSNARRGAELATKALAGDGDPVLLTELLHHERNGVWTIVALSVVNILLGVWRPRLSWRVATDAIDSAPTTEKYPKIYISPVLLVRQDITHKAITSHKVRL